MTDQSGLADFDASGNGTRWIDDMLAQAARDRLVQAIANVPPRHSCTIMAAALDDLGAGSPEAALYSCELRADAAFWADCATPPELEAYAAAALRRISRVAFAEMTRKRLIVMLWETLSGPDKQAFLASVDPEGKFRGAGK